jgi:hypothetical protein
MTSIAVTAGLLGLACMIAGNIAKSAFYRGDTLREGFSVTDNDRVVRVLGVALEGTD